MSRNAAPSKVERTRGRQSPGKISEPKSESPTSRAYLAYLVLNG